MKTAIYIRVSTEEQATEGYSLSVQEEALKEYANKHGHEIYKVYSDDVSGFSPNRPALKQLLIDAKLNKFDLVLVYKVDRFSRNQMHLLNLVYELESYGIAFKSTTEPFDTTTSNGKFMFQQFGSFAEFERNRIMERVKPGMLKSLEQGHWQGGKPPYGYSYNQGFKKLEIMPEEAEVVKLIFKMYLNNQSIQQISGYLDGHGFKNRSGGKCYTTMVGDILRNKIYIGQMVWGKSTIDKKAQNTNGQYKVVKTGKPMIFKGEHEPVISTEDFELVQKKLDANRKGVFHRSNNAGYPLTGILFCGKCTHSYRGANATTNNRTKAKKRTYRCCSRQEHHVRCANPSIKADFIESQIYQIVEKLMTHPDIQRGRGENIVKSANPVEGLDLIEQMKILKKRLKENLEQQTELGKLWRKRTLSPEVLEVQAADITKEEKEINKAMAKLDVQMIEKERSEEYKGFLDMVVSQFNQTQEEFNIQGLKRVLRLIFVRIVVDNGRITEVECYEPFQSFFRYFKNDMDAIMSSENEYAECSNRGTVG